MAILLAGCAAAPVVAPPSLPSPAHWEGKTDAVSPSAADPATVFWAGFGDPLLLDLQRQAALANPDLLIAADRLLIARDAVLAARAQQKPSLAFNAGAVDNAATAVADHHARRQAVYELGLDASYELDFWGRLDSLTASAKAEAEARALDNEAARIGLTSLVAQTYFGLAEADDTLALLDRRRTLADERLNLQTARQKAGKAGGALVLEAVATVDGLQQQQAQVRRQRRELEWQMALLLGRLPETCSVPAGPLRRQLRLTRVPADLPSTLLQRRPDLRAAEARWEAAQARIGAARAERFPQIKLTAQLGVATDVLHGVSSGAVGLFGFGPGISYSVYDGGTRAANLDSSEREADIALLEYRKATFLSFVDVEKALQMHEAALAQQQQVDARTARLHDMARQVEAQVAAGRMSRLDLIAAEEQRLDAEAGEVESYRAQLDSELALFQALGGGWSADVELQSTNSEKQNPT